MVKIRFLGKGGDATKTCTMQEATQILDGELKKGNLVINEDEKQIVERATKGQLTHLTEASNVAVFKPVAGG